MPAKVDAGLPNITASFIRVIVAPSGHQPSGALVGEKYGVAQVGVGSTELYNVDFDASRSSEIYGASTTVQPSSFSLLPQIKY